MTRAARVLPMITLLLLSGVLGTWASRHSDAARVQPGPRPVPLWNADLRDLGEALAVGDRSQALRVWNAAWTDAVGSRRWEPLIAVGDAALHVGKVTGAQAEARVSARRAYRMALLRARANGSVEGVMRAADAFASLGDRDVTAVALQIARQLAVSSADRDLRARLEVTAASSTTAGSLPQPR
jgi:hypothetical protein